MSQNREKLKYYEDSDILHYLIKEGEETWALEVAPGVTLEMDSEKNIIGIEILNASKFLNQFVINSFKKELEQELTKSTVTL